MPATLEQLAAWAADPPERGRLVVPTPPLAELPEVTGLLAGAAEVDITPPPGMPKSGHSLNATDGTGFRTRLKARVVHLRAGRASVAIVACDLHAGSALVHRLVAEAVADRTDVPLAGLCMGATHTHAGPGQFHGSDFYNRWASNRPGMDPAFVTFLTERIAGAVVEAVATREPATAAVGTTEVWGVTRNRSLEAHLRNAGTVDRRTEPQRRYAAVNPELHLLRVDTAGGPLAALATFSIHGTGISRLDPSYNADVWAYLVGQLHRTVTARTGSAGFVAGAIEGTHGDMTPAVTPGLLAYPEAERVGRLIGAAAGRLHADLEGALRPTLDLRTGLVEVDLDTDPVLGGVRLPPAAVGTAKIAGAEENTTPLVERLPPFSPNHPKPFARGPHGAKWIFGGPIQRRVIPPGTFPRVLPVQVVRLGGTTLVGVPFEVTVAAGRRLAAAVGGERVVVSSVANDYWDYLTTPEEYALQRYEGASTIYGPQSLAFVTAAAVGLARRLSALPVVQDVPASRTFDNRLHRYLPPPSTGRVAPVGAPRFVDATVGESAYWEARFTGGALTWHEPVARVERLDPSGPVVVADDGGWHVGVSLDRRGLVVRWYGPPLGAPARHRVVLAGVEGPAFD